MGGLAFCGKTTVIRLENVDATLDHFFQKCFFPISITEYIKIGSTGKKHVSNDLDIAIEADIADKIRILNHLISILGDGSTKLVGNNIAIRYGIRDGYGFTGEYVQIDVMLVNNLSDASWLMHGTADGIKGVYRNLLLAYVAKIASDDSQGTVKFTVGFPSGLMVSGSSPSPSRITDPQLILDNLGISCFPNEAQTFEGLCRILASDPKFKIRLSGFELYIQGYFKAKSSSLEAKRANEFLNSFLP